MIVVGLVALLAATLVLPIRSWLEQRAQIADLEEQISVVQSDLDALTARERELADPKSIEVEARQRLDYVFPGEVGLIVVPRAPGAGPAAVKDETWLTRLWRSVDAAAGRADGAAEVDPIPIRPDAPR